MLEILTKDFTTEIIKLIPCMILIYERQTHKKIFWRDICRVARSTDGILNENE